MEVAVLNDTNSVARKYLLQVQEHRAFIVKYSACLSYSYLPPRDAIKAD